MNCRVVLLLRDRVRPNEVRIQKFLSHFPVNFLDFMSGVTQSVWQMLSRLARVAVAFLLLTAAVQRPQGERIIAVGDVHGNLDGFTSILQSAGLIDQQRQWTGGKATLVQLGDLVDRGPKSRAVLDFIMTLQNEAPRKGGTVLVSLGNHEVMNIIGDMRYVVPADYESFLDNRSEQRRAAAFREYSSLETRKGRVADQVAWMNAHPLGFVEHREAYGPQGKYGKWLRGVPTINKVEDSIFLHGGINPALNFKNIEQFNSGVKNEMQIFDKITRYMIDRGLALPFFTLDEFAQAASEELNRTNAIKPEEQTPEGRAHTQILEGLVQLPNWLSIHDAGPLWFRGYDRWSDVDGEPQLARLIQSLGIKRIVVAHTPQPNGEIRQRFGGKVFLIDTALVTGRASALEIQGDRIRAIYSNRQTEFN